MRISTKVSSLFPRQFALLALASAIAIPVWAQQPQQPAADTQNAPASAAQQQPATSIQPMNTQKEGFWGRVNPFARKKWVKRQTDPINDRLSELDEVNARNARDIKDVDARAQAGIQKAQSSADAAGQQAAAANQQAMSASNTAQQASRHVDQVNGTVNGLDQYHQITEAEIKFRGGSPELTADSKATLDQLAASLTGRDGYILEMEAHAPASGSAGIQQSERLAEAVKRYLVTEHQIPVYRMHSVALGNMVEVASTDTGNSGNTQEQKPERIRTSSVYLRLMENSLAAPAGAPPQSATAAAGAGQP
jgi:outer membrane protein OmpA-like peptidoglycan-associated protein